MLANLTVSKKNSSGSREPNGGSKKENTPHSTEETESNKDFERGSMPRKGRDQYSLMKSIGCL